MRYDSSLSFIFSMPTRVVYEAGAVREVAMEAERLGIQRALLVSDRVLAEQTDLVDRVRKALGNRVSAVFLDVPPDSSVESVEAGYAVGTEACVEGIVSVGGGSVIDTAKGIAILLKEGGRLRDYVGFQNLTRKVAPHIVLPTTSGTGSEVTYAAVIKDHQEQRKLLFGDYNILPDCTILDPELTVGLPAALTAATGMDALSHAIEAMHSMQKEPIADALALHAIRLLREAIPVCVEDPGNLAARGQQLLAACLAGAAFSNAQVGLVHAMAHTVGARHGIHHGLANSICLPHVIRFNGPLCHDAYRSASHAFGVKLSEDPTETAEAFAGALYDFAGSIGLPTSLKAKNVPEDALADLAEATLSDGAIVYNGRPAFDVEELKTVWKAAWNG